jgi:hypothetical protein
LFAPMFVDLYQDQIVQCSWELFVHLNILSIEKDK